MGRNKKNAPAKAGAPSCYMTTDCGNPPINISVYYFSQNCNRFSQKNGKLLQFAF